MKKALVALLALVLVLTAIPCIAETKEVKTFRITLPQATLVTDYYDNYFTKWVEETYGCKFEFQFLPADQAASKLAVMVAAGEDLGDLLYWQGITKSAILNYADAGALLPLTEYFETLDTNLERVSEEIGQDLVAAVTTADGEVFGYPTYYPEANNMTKYRAWINTTWLDNLGLAMPTTLDELYNVLVAFRDGDANGNGDPNDEIPMLGCSSGWSTNPTVFLISAFIYWDDVLDLNIDADGVITAAYAQQTYKEALQYINKLVSEGLLATDTFSITYTQYQEYLNTPIPTVGIHFYTHLGDMDTTSENINQYQYMPYLIGNDGLQRISYQPYDTSAMQCWFIPAGCSDPDAAFALIDSLFSTEAYIRCRFGVEGVHYDKVTDAETLSFLGSNHDFAILEYPVGWGEANNMSWQSNMGYFTGSGYMCQWNGDPNYYFYKRLVAVNDMLTLAPSFGEYVPALTFTVDETEIYNEFYNNITTYWKECQTLFILGEMNFESGWNEYLSTLESLGLADYLALCQTAYVRQYGK